MATAPVSAEQPTNASTTNGHANYRFALTSLTSLFFMWGFITCLNDILIPHLKGIFDLTYAQAMLIQFCFFGAYFIVSLPAGVLVKKLGYQYGIVSGLIIAAMGCLLFYPAASMHSYPVFLFALFVLAAGITVLQVSANPYVSCLGKPETASSRLTLTQAFNSLGTTVAPFFGAYLILNETAEAMVNAQQQAEAVQMPYVLLAAMLLILAAIFAKLKLPHIEHQQAQESSSSSMGSAWQYSHLVLGAVGIFVYVGAEVAIGSFLVNYFHELQIPGLETEAQAAKYIAYYWGGAMVGRFIGGLAMQKIAAGKALAFNAVAAILLIAITMVSDGQLAMWSILLVGLCNSIMFPTIFSLAVTGLGRHTSQGSGVLCLAIVGGAIIPLAQGLLADMLGVQTSFFLPIICYAFIVFYGLVGSKPKLKQA